MKKSTMEDAKQEKTPGETCNGTSQARSVLAKPRLGGFGSSSFSSSSSKTNNPFGSVLRPPQLKATPNPFLKPNPAIPTEKDKEASENRLNESKENIEVPKFVPLGGANVAGRNASSVSAQAPSSAPAGSFVFGQNLSERVVIKENVNNGEASSTEHSSSNGTSELLFTNAAAASAKENNQESDPSKAETSNREGLAAAAAEYERSHARPLPPTSNCTITGEEDETNVLQISCRLFAWESGSWRERGRGVLRLNECGVGGVGGVGGADGAGGARLVARVAGSLRVVLNTKLWPDMLADQAGPKSLRITALDAQQQIKLFLIMGSPGDIVQLTRAIKARVQTSKKPTNTCSQNAPSQSAAARLDADTDDAECGEPADRLADTTPTQAPTQQPTTHEYESNVDGMTNEKESKPLKRKEPIADETSSKRQCPEIVID